MFSSGTTTTEGSIPATLKSLPKVRVYKNLPKLKATGRINERGAQVDKAGADGMFGQRQASSAGTPRALPQNIPIAGGEGDHRAEDHDRNAAPSDNGLTDDGRGYTDNQVLLLLATLGYHVTAADLDKLGPWCTYEAELELMAEVRGYTQISYRRVIDIFPMTIERVFLRGFADALREYVVAQLALGTPDAAAACAMYGAENLQPDFVTLRDELMEKKRRLVRIQGKLDHLRQ